MKGEVLGSQNWLGQVTKMNSTKAATEKIGDMETPALTLAEAARLFYSQVLGVGIPRRGGSRKEKSYSTSEPELSRELSFYSIPDLAKRWRCSRATVYNRLRAEGARVLDFAPPSKKGKKVVSAIIVYQIEHRRTKRLC